MDAAHKSVRTEPAAIAEGEVSHTDCRGFADILARIGDKWTVLIVGSLSGGRLRYKELHREGGGHLAADADPDAKGLEEDGLVSRTVYPTIPPRVDYELTELGRTLIVPLAPLYQWTTEHGGEIADARRRYTEVQAKKPLW